MSVAFLVECLGQLDISTCRLFFWLNVLVFLRVGCFFG